jgi:hypothetical protein
MNFTENVDFSDNVVFTRAMRIVSAKRFLQENFTEIIACAARIYPLVIFTLHDSIKYDKDETRMSQRDEHNKVLQEHEVETLHEFIKSLLLYDISSSNELVFDAISALKLAEQKDASSRR